MKKGVFSLMNYVLPKMGILSLHSGCNEGAAGDVTLFFGLSGVRGRLSGEQVVGHCVACFSCMGAPAAAQAATPLAPHPHPSQPDPTPLQARVRRRCLRTPPAL